MVLKFLLQMIRDRRHEANQRCAVFERKSSFRQGGRNFKVVDQSLSIIPSILFLNPQTFL